MVKRNIFLSESLELFYNSKRDYYVLKRQENVVGGRKYYSDEAIYELSRSIYNEMKKPEHSMDYNLKEFKISLFVKKRIQKIEQEIFFKKNQKKLFKKSGQIS